MNKSKIIPSLSFFLLLNQPGSQLRATPYSNIENEQKDSSYFSFPLSNLPTNFPILQMNPATVEEVIEGEVALKHGLGFSKIEEGRIANSTATHKIAATDTIETEKAEESSATVKLYLEQPQILENIAQAACEKASIAREEAKTATGDILECKKQLASSFEKIAKYWNKAAEAIILGNSVLIKDYTQAAEQSEKAVEDLIQAVESYTAFKKLAGNSWSLAAKTTQASADMMIKASEARVVGNEALAAKYTEVSEKYYSTIEPIIEAAKIFATGKENEARRSLIVGRLGQIKASSMEYKIQANELRVANQEYLADKYTTVAEKLECVLNEYYIKATQAHAAGKKDEGNSWYNISYAIQISALTLVKGIEAEEQGKAALATQYQKASEKLDQAANEYYLKATQAYAAGKTEEGSSWYNAGFITRIGAESFITVIEAEDSGKTILAGKYKKAYEEQDRAAEYYINATQSYIAGKTNEGNSWNNAGLAIRASAEMFIKGIEAEEGGQAVLAKQYQAASEKLDRTVSEYYIKAIQAYVVGKTDEGNRWSNAGIATQKNAETLIQGIEMRVVGNEIEALKYDAESEKWQQKAEELIR